MGKLYANFRALVEQLREDKSAHYNDARCPGFRAIAVYRAGVWRRTLPVPLRKLLYPVYQFAYRWIRTRYGITLFWTTSVGRRVTIANQGNVSIHFNAVIGDDCLIRQNVTLGGISDERNDGPTLGRQVHIGAGAVIIGPIRVGDGARIGPNAVIMSDVPAGAIAVAPATRIIMPRTRPSTLQPGAGGNHDGAPVSSRPPTYIS
jgi:serine O-acetyltransferase